MMVQKHFLSHQFSFLSLYLIQNKGQVELSYGQVTFVNYLSSRQPHFLASCMLFSKIYTFLSGRQVSW